MIPGSLNDYLDDRRRERERQQAEAEREAHPLVPFVYAISEPVTVGIGSSIAIGVPCVDIRPFRASVSTIAEIVPSAVVYLVQGDAA